MNVNSSSSFFGTDRHQTFTLCAESGSIKLFYVGAAYTIFCPTSCYHVAWSYHRVNSHPWEGFPTFREIFLELGFNAWTITGIHREPWCHHDSAFLSTCLAEGRKLLPIAIIIRCLRPISLPGGQSRAFPTSPFQGRDYSSHSFYASFRYRSCLARRPLFSRSQCGLHLILQ